MPRLVWLPEALDDLDRLYDFIAEHSEHAAETSATKIVHSAKTLLDFPRKGRPYPDDAQYRELTVASGSRGYIIRYRASDEEVTIMRVWHQLEDR